MVTNLYFLIHIQFSDVIFEVAINVTRNGGLNCDPFKNYS